MVQHRYHIEDEAIALNQYRENKKQGFQSTTF